MPVALIVPAFRPFYSHTVSGKVNDDKGSPISAVSIMVKGTNTETASSQDGTYKITVTDSSATLVFSAVGYATQEVNVQGKTTIDISMKAAGAELQEVVVTALGIQK